MTDLDEEFQTAVRRARDAKPGLGFGLSLVGALTGDVSPVTVSSGSRLSGDVRVTPPPTHRRDRSGTRGSEISTSSDPFHPHRTILGVERRLPIRSQPFPHIQGLARGLSLKQAPPQKRIPQHDLPTRTST